MTNLTCSDTETNTRLVESMAMYVHWSHNQYTEYLLEDEVSTEH